MDGSQFDQLSRRLAGFRTRRQAVRAIAGAVIATVAGGRASITDAHATVAPQCAAQYSPCTDDETCCSGSVCQSGMCMPACRIDGTFVNAWTSPAGDICNQCLPEVSTTSWSPANEGMSCWSGDPSAGATFCQSGTCAPTGPAQCPPPPPCYTDPLIDPATCTYAVAEAGTPCGIDAMCYGGFYQPADTCDGNGFCIGGGSQTVSCAPYLCGDGACRSTCDTDNDCVGGTTCCDGACVALGTDDHCAACGDACDGGGRCCDGACVALGTDDDCLACGDTCPGDLHCDPGVGCVECVTDAHCHVDNSCDTVACVNSQCITTPGEGGTCGNYVIGCGGDSCRDFTGGTVTTCVQTVDLGPVCIADWDCSSAWGCDTSENCEEGFVCVINNCCGENHCVRRCGSDAELMTVVSASAEHETDGPIRTGLGN